MAHVARRAALRAEEARSRIARLTAGHSVSQLVESARVTMSFHPDRLGREGVTVAECLLRDGEYRSQFDTGVTNGSPTAFPGGERDRWEAHLFGGAYHESPPSTERPKYGALNIMQHPDGGSPRFGSCYFTLSSDVASRCTFTWGDSHQQPEHAGTLAEFDGVLAEWLTTVDVATLVLPKATRAPGRALDVYIEAQVHGRIELARDVEALVIDPAFDGTTTGALLATLAERYEIPLRRHPGFVLRADEVPSDFRGPRMRPLAERLAGDADFDAATLGRAALSLVREPAKWQDWGTEAETWQHIKQLWHCLVQFGRAR